MAQPSEDVESTNELIAQPGCGPIRGVRARGVNGFKGIPYAAAPTGALRFLSPQPVAPWKEPLDGTMSGSIAPQQGLPGAFASLATPEGKPGPDYLKLNVWTPALDDRRRPVIVWIHGGGFVSGAGSDSIFDGTAFARDDVVFVTLNYRLGAEGFLYLGELFPQTHSSGCQGLQDQVAALVWVRENITAFGGDPRNVTIAGQSAGAYAVATLLAAPSAKDLFRRAILQSGAADKVVSTETAAYLTSVFLDIVAPDDRSLAALQVIPPEQIFAAQVQLARRHQQTRDDPAWKDLTNKSGIFRPVWGTGFLPEPPLVAIEAGAVKDVDLLLGTNADENQILFVEKNDMFNVESTGATLRTLFGPHSDEVWASYSQSRHGTPPGLVFGVIEADRSFRIPTIRIAEAQLAAGGRAPFMYEFAWPSTSFGGRMGAYHMSEIPFVFDSLGSERSVRISGDDAPQHLADEMHGAWVAFARSGNPSTSAAPEWPAYDDARRPVLRFDSETTLVEDPLGDERKLWEGVAL